MVSTNPDAKHRTHMTVSCPFCGDKSFSKVFDGRFVMDTPNDIAIRDFEVGVQEYDGGICVTRVFAHAELKKG
jgi:hypothetical protein